jgi:chromosome segregation ATPase
MSVDLQFNSINDKLQQLLRQYARLQKENERLKQELHVVRSREMTAQQEIEAFQQQISILKLGSADFNDRDKKDFEKKINQYLKEIDKCISFLSQ